MKSRKSNKENKGTTKGVKKNYNDKKINNAPKRKRLTIEPEKENNNFLSSQNYGVR